MDTLPPELIVIIVNCFGLNTSSQLAFLTSCRSYHKLTAYLQISELVTVYQQSVSLKHYDNLTNIHVKRNISRFPLRVERVKLSHRFTLSLNRLPLSTRSLTLPSFFHSPQQAKFYLMQLASLMQITELNFNDRFNMELKHGLPPNLTKLTFSDNFNKPVGQFLPTKLTSLTFGHDFNQPVDHFPVNLTSLTFGNYFNQPVCNFPSNLTNLNLGYHFKQPLDNCLPSTLTHLTVNQKFSRFHKNRLLTSLPPNLTHIFLEDLKEEDVLYFVPKVTHLIVDCFYYNGTNPNSFPPNITHFTCLSVEIDINEGDELTYREVLESINKNVPPYSYLFKSGPLGITLLLTV